MLSSVVRRTVLRTSMPALTQATPRHTARCYATDYNTGYPNSNKTTNPPEKTFSKDENTKLKAAEADPSQAAKLQQLKKRTQAQSDEELMRKLEEMSGDGGVAGLELEDGKPVAMKRGVAANMFRLI